MFFIQDASASFSDLGCNMEDYLIGEFPEQELVKKYWLIKKEFTYTKYKRMKKL